MPAEAAKVCARLARLYFEPSRRAAALYRQAEILRDQLDNPAAALDAYLRSSDLDPRFVPSRLRLVDHFWNVGDLDVVAELANDLNAVPLSADSEPELVVRLAIATTTLRGGATSRFPFTPALGQVAVRAIVEAAGHQELIDNRPIEALDPMLTRARIWAGADGEPTLYATLIDMVREDPGQPGAASALGRFAETGVRLALANAAYGIAAFVVPGCPAAQAHARPSLPRPHPAGGRGHRRAGRPSRFRPGAPGGRWPAWRRRCSATAPKRPRRSRPKAAVCRRRAPPSCAGSAICWRRLRSSSCATPASPRRAKSAAGCASSRPSPRG